MMARLYAEGLVPADQWPCLNQLWEHESGWRSTADNPTSTAYGIAQELTETSNDPQQQIRDGLDYINHRYGSACAAWTWWTKHRWY